MTDKNDVTLTVGDEIDILTGEKEAPADPRFEAVPDYAPLEPQPEGGEPADVAEPASAEPPTSEADKETPPPTAPEEPSSATEPVPQEPESPPSPSSEDSEKESLQAQVAALQAQIRELLDKVPEATPQSPTPQSTTEAPAEPQAPPATKQFVKDEAEFDQIISSVDNFNAFIGRVVQEARAGAVEQAYTNLPQVVSGMVNRQMAFGQLVREFYKDNPDLVPHAKFASFVMNELAAQSPETEIPQLLSKTGEEVRKRLGIVKKAEAPGPASGAPVRTNSPAFAAGPGTRKAGPAPLAGLEKEVNDLLDLP